MQSKVQWFLVEVLGPFYVEPLYSKVRRFSVYSLKDRVELSKGPYIKF